MLKKAYTFVVLCFLLVSFPLSAGAKDFSYENLLYTLYKINGNVDYEQIVDSYMASFRKNVWRKYKNDEFELEEKRADTIALLKNRVAKVDLAEPFNIRAKSEFGNYNFKKGEYEFTPIAPNTYFYESHCCNSLPGKIQFMFKNGNVVDGIPMEKEAAKKFLNSRKRSYGSVDRRVLLDIEAVPKIISDSNTITAEIISYKIIDDKTNKTLLSWPSK